MSQSSSPPAAPILFVRGPHVDKMRDPLNASWNTALKAHAAPCENNIPLDLAALIDFSQLNQTFADYLDVVGLPVAIIDLEGKVLASSKWQRLCMEFHRVNERTLERCLESDVSLSRQMQDGKGYAIYGCLNGLTDCAAPIVVEGHHVANLFIGQFFLQAPEQGRFERQCAEFGFDQDAYFEALAEVPVIDENKVPAIMRLLTGLANQVAQQSLAAYRLKVANESLNERNLALSLAKEAAEAASVAKTAFLANISHEMRTPLNHIQGMASLIRREPLSARQTDRLEKLETACRNMTGVIENILELTRIEAGRFEIGAEIFSMRDLLRETLQLVGEQASAKRIPIAIEASGVPDEFMGGRQQIKQALLNYLDNAIRFTEVGGIVIRVRLMESNNEQALLRLEVHDSGIGIAAEDQPRLFSIFQQVDNSSTRKYGGLGVGLAMTRKIAQLMGGDAGCESRPSEGTTFWFTVRLMLV